MEDSSNFTAKHAQILSPAQHYALGTWLVSSGIVGGFFNLAGLLMFLRFPRVLWNPSAIPEIGLMLSDLCVAGLHPFSGTAALLNRWPWGPVGCQLYAVSGFLFGSFQLLCVPFIAFDRFLTTCKPAWEERYRNYGTYCKIFVALFIVSAFFAVTPLLGWASYALSPVGVSCTIDWMNPNTAYTSYLTAYTLAAYCLPLPLALLLYSITASAIRKPDSPSVHWTNKANLGFTILGCSLVTYVSFAGYAIVCIWAMVGDPRDIPSGMNVLPPPMAKIAGVLNPFFYIYCHPLHWACMRTLLGCCNGPAEEALLEEAEATQKRKEIQLSSRSDRAGKTKEQMEVEEVMLKER